MFFIFFLPSRASLCAGKCVILHRNSENESIMTPAEYIQLKAFARQDGALLALWWIASFGCYVAGLLQPVLGMLAVLMALSTPIVAALRLRHFRDVGRDGIISMGRGWGFVVLIFFYAGLLLAVAQYAYFSFMDHGFMFDAMDRMLHTPEAGQMLQQYGMAESVDESISQMRAMRPIDIALNMLTTNILVGMVVALPIAAVMQRQLKTEA